MHCKRKLLFLALTALLLVAPPMAHAGFINKLNQENVFKFDKAWNWTFDQAKEERKDELAPWKINLSATPATLDGMNRPKSKDLTVELQHLRRRHTDKDAAGAFRENQKSENLSLEITVTRPDPGEKTRDVSGAFKAEHPTIPGHIEMYKLVVRNTPLNAGPLFLSVSGEHFGEDVPFNWSYTNTSKKKGTLNVRGSYPSGEKPATGGGLDAQGDRMLNPGQGSRGTIEKGSFKDKDGKVKKEDPTDYGLKFTFNPSTDTLLQFIGGSAGSYEKLELGAATRLFVGTDDFIVPMLSHADIDLFVGVDLVRWLTSPVVFAPDDIFSIVGGTSDLLPGFLIGRSPVSFDPVLGLVTASPFTGDSTVAGIIDGNAVPAPSTIALLLLGLGAAEACRRCSAA